MLDTTGVPDEIRKLAAMTDETLIKINDNLAKVNAYNTIALLQLENGIEQQVDHTKQSSTTFTSLSKKIDELQQHLHRFHEVATSIDANSDAIINATNNFAKAMAQSNTMINALRVLLNELSNDQLPISLELEQTYANALTLRSM